MSSEAHSPTAGESAVFRQAKPWDRAPALRASRRTSRPAARSSSSALKDPAFGASRLSIGLGENRYRSGPEQVAVCPGGRPGYLLEVAPERL